MVCILDTGLNGSELALTWQYLEICCAAQLGMKSGEGKWHKEREEKEKCGRARNEERQIEERVDIKMNEIATFDNNLCCELYRKISRFPFNMSHWESNLALGVIFLQNLNAQGNY